ncbi:MAG: cytochrome c3 family protein [Sporocytophaga sp.]|uniref:cytochrome c3 family protein n=1 Tax=Sporocytophaga sp. TaxID=2231183 RepID=UPI001B1B9BCF|nr:cytochrome c3 family protein [Sporocytophaga sp.]MBO9700814.1 cytochrome c3 family protein [Sporocytophaga sp.]
MKFFSLKNVNKNRRRQVIGGIAGSVFSILMILVLTMPSNEKLLCKGPMNIGHETLECSSCHQNAQGTIRQQFQAKAKLLLSLRKDEPDFGKMDVDNKGCINCHQRENDRHPVNRFMEPRFEKVRSELAVEKCETCHREHQGVRVTLNDIQYCENCHDDLDVKEDPLDVSHKVLVKNAQWNTCLQCHDFHGNHQMKVPVLLKDTIPHIKVMEYINGGLDPYSADKIYKAITDLKNEE